MPLASHRSRSGSALPRQNHAHSSLSDALALARDTKALCVGPDAVRQTAAMFYGQFPGRRAVVVADRNTFAVAGRHVHAMLSTAGLSGPQTTDVRNTNNEVHALLSVAGLSGGEPVIFPDHAFFAEYRWIDWLVGLFRLSDAIPVAVGSGTINDLVKLAAHLTGRAYLCVATAASMDGYTAFGASVTRHGAKQTFSCPAPRAVIADIEIMRAAPPGMTASGYADLQAKLTAGADWIIADELGVESVEPQAWMLVQRGLRAALADPAGARAGETTAITALTEGLMLGGFAMQCLQSSRPASGAEHQFSHLWDMEHLTCDGSAPSHGFKVGVATLAVASLYEALLRRPLDQIDIDQCCDQWQEWPETERHISSLFAHTDFLVTALTETRTKHIPRSALRTQLTRLRERWPVLRTRLQDQLPPATELRRRLQLVGAPVTPEAIGLTRERLRCSFQRAYHIRRRFTVLDLAVHTATLEECLDELFGPGGFWSDCS